jgi:hypothetical protein
MHRGARFEDEIQKALDEKFPGSVVDGGGSEVSEEFRITGCDIDVEIVSRSVESALKFVGDTVYHLGASRGSWISAGDGSRVACGGTEAFSVRVPGYGMDQIEGEDADGVPITGELVDVMKALEKGLSPNAHIVSWRINPDDTDIFAIARTFDPVSDDVAEVAERVSLLSGYQIVRFD